MDSRFQTINGYSFSKKQLQTVMAVQKDDYVRQYLIDWVLSLPNVQNAMREELLRVQDKYNRDFDTLLYYSLNGSFGFGKERLKRLNDEMIRNRKILKGFYKGDMADTVTFNCDIEAMHEELKRKGYAPEQLELEEESKKCLTEKKL